MENFTRPCVDRSYLFIAKVVNLHDPKILLFDKRLSQNSSRVFTFHGWQFDEFLVVVVHVEPAGAMPPRLAVPAGGAGAICGPGDDGRWRRGPRCEGR